jgi:hypothetical protein
MVLDVSRRAILRAAKVRNKTAECIMNILAEKVFLSVIP